MNSIPHQRGAVKQSTRAHYIVFSALCLTVAIAYLSRNVLSPVEKSIEEDLRLSKEAMSLIMGSFFYTYRLMQIPGGWLSDRFGTWLVLPMLATVWALATAAGSRRTAT
jgi:ACS family D-galactonate transporter-like MFS transporter